ncbi:MoaE protein [Paucidesulfovibrio gracilis DSM 16080]|uniref:Molybdopterin synthase catalytic subunit n=1 Tax=Paucidesulfovibrio gracilis DSM 16080 TaxID=1121449 RepID=A0A1T4WRC4_9BACT|nr:molybdenum cofactor biosynthesis protein MoaE [Paucidesulfovibrio gracilis]SKA79903.1 MoaE protein [Paucidesulfovibrio gracilis DSM 16080]
MDLTKTIAELKTQPGFTENVGMMLIHNGVVRGWSRKDRNTVTAVDVQPDLDKIKQLCRECEQRPGIWRAVAQANKGHLVPGDDLLFIIVAGDIRENVKPALADLLDQIKSQAVTKQEVFA